MTRFGALTPTQTLRLIAALYAAAARTTLTAALRRATTRRS